MATYETMREAAQNGGEWAPAVAWLLTPEGFIRIGWLLEHEPLGRELEAALTDARRRGFSYRACWDYYAAQGGRNQYTLRTTPEELEADDDQEALYTALARLRNSA